MLGHWRMGLGAAVGIVMTVGAWMLAMQSLSLPVLPSSVMVKSGVAANAIAGGDGGVLRTAKAILDNVRISVVLERQGAILLLTLSVLVLGVFNATRRGERYLAVGVGASCALAVLAHLAVGQYDWFARYEVYIISASVLASLVLWRRTLTFRSVQLVALWALSVVGLPYVYAGAKTPLASRGIYEQQYQMHRFATEFWKRPVAVNDLGYVSYRNPAFVLDLWGLGAEDVRQIRSHGEFSSDAISSLVGKHHVSLAMIYESWFVGLIPEQWTRVAVMNTRSVTAADSDVSFFAVGETEPARELLRRFGATLPPRVVLHVME